MKWRIVSIFLFTFFCIGLFNPILSAGNSDKPQCYVFDDHALYAVDVVKGSLREMIRVDAKEFISGIKFSPNQKFASIITGTKKYERSKLYLLDTEKQIMRKITEIGTDSTITIPFWSPDSKQFVVLFGFNEIASGDFTHYESYWLKLFQMEQEKLLDIIKLNESINSLEWSPNGKYIAFNGKENKDFSLYMFDTFLLKNNMITTNLRCDWWYKNLNHWSKDSNILFSINGSAFFSYEIQTVRYKQILDTGKQILLQQWADNVDRVLIVTKESEESILHEIDMTELQLTLINRNFQVDSPRWSPDGKTISYFSKGKNDLFSKVTLYEFNSKKIIQEAPVGSVEIYPWDIDPDYSNWSNDSKKILILIKKNNQSQYVTKCSVVEKNSMAISSDWEYVYNYWWAMDDDWIAVSGNRKEKDVLEFIPLDKPENRITFTEKRFIAWQNQKPLDNPIPEKPSNHKTKPTTIYYSIGVVGFVLLWWIFSRMRK